MTSFSYFLVHFWYWDLFWKGSMLQMWAQFWKKIILNPIPYKILGKLLKFHTNWIINKNVIRRKPTWGYCASENFESSSSYSKTILNNPSCPGQEIIKYFLDVSSAKLSTCLRCTYYCFASFWYKTPWKGRNNKCKVLSFFSFRRHTLQYTRTLK